MKKDLPKIIQRIDIPNAPELRYVRCTGIYKHHIKRDYVTADYYIQNKDLFKIIMP